MKRAHYLILLLLLDTCNIFFWKFLKWKSCKFFIFLFFFYLNPSALGEKFFFSIEALLELTHFKIYTRARGREQFTVTRDFMPFTLEVLQSKYLLFFKISKAGINFATDWFLAVGLEYLLVKYCLVGLEIELLILKYWSKK